MAKVQLTPAFLDRLRGLAQNCQPPIWQLNEHSDVVSVAHTVAEVAYDEDAQFIAAADPATVLAMVEEIEQLTKTSQELFDKTKALEQEIEQIKRQAENNVKHVPYYTGKGPLEQAIEILGTRELNKVIQSRKESEAGQ